MHSAIPYVPADELGFTGKLKLKVDGVCNAARVFKFWNRPYKNAATSYEEMSLLDICYWVYKNTSPITKTERGQRPEALIVTDKSLIKLPYDFRKHHSLTVGAAGDLIQAESLNYSKDILYEGVADLLFNQDISYASMEFAISEGEPEKAPLTGKACPVEYTTLKQFDNFKGHKGKVFDVLHTATNHMFDIGAEGVKTTRKVLAQEGILDVGTNGSREELGQAKILTRCGIKVGFASAGFGLNGHAMPAEENYLINYSRLLPKTSEPELDLLKQQIDDCKKQGCDFIIASLHWGYEFELFPRKRQVDIAHTLVEWGADAILGHHTHVIQPVEYYRTHRDPNRVAVIAYSLGSLAWTFSAPHLILSAILNLKLTKGSFKGKEVTYIESAEVTPVFRSYVKDGDKIVTRIEKLASCLDKQDATIAKVKKFADLVLGNYGASNASNTAIANLSEAA